MAITANRIPERIIIKASLVLSQYRKGRIHAKRLYSHVLRLEVGYRYRLLSHDDGKNWEIMSHEKYNKSKQRKRLKEFDKSTSFKKENIHE
ncbi:TPA: hypothetical protein ACYZE8_002402 [Salmonella enterica]